MNKIFNTMLLCFSMQACSSTPLSTGGQEIEVVTNLDRKDCKNLGPIFAKGGNFFYGGLVRDEKLMEKASINLRNQAAGMGATHVVVFSHQVGQTSGEFGGTTSTVTQQGVAYSCPKK